MCHFAYTTPRKAEQVSYWKSLVFWLKQAYSQPVTACGLIEGELSTDIVVLDRDHF